MSSSFLFGAGTPGFLSKSGYAVVSIGPNGLGLQFNFRGGPDSLPAARGFLSDSAQVGRTYYIVEAPADLTVPLNRSGPFKVIGGGYLSANTAYGGGNIQWTYSTKDNSLWYALGLGAAIVAGILIYKKR